MFRWPTPTVNVVSVAPNPFVLPSFYADAWRTDMIISRVWRLYSHRTLEKRRRKKEDSGTTFLFSFSMAVSTVSPLDMRCNINPTLHDSGWLSNHHWTSFLFIFPSFHIGVCKIWQCGLQCCFLRQGSAQLDQPGPTQQDIATARLESGGPPIAGTRYRVIHFLFTLNLTKI